MQVNPAAWKALTLGSHAAFTRYFWKHRHGNKMLWAAHHAIMARVFDDILAGRRKRVIINLPPGFTKTEMLVALVSRGLAINPASRSIYTSASDLLVQQCSSDIRDTVLLPEYQALFPMSLRADTNAKGLWRVDGPAGGLLARPSSGQIIGFRAGLMQRGTYTGVLAVDDPLKQSDARSPVKRDYINSLYNNTLRNRLALDDETPVVIIMQRLHEDDLSGFLLKGGSGEVWDHLCLPAIIDNDAVYPAKYTHGRPIAHNLPDGPLWPDKFSAEKLALYRASDKVTFSGQYMQDPIPTGDRVFEPEWWRYYDPTQAPQFEWRGIYADTAQKVQERHDYSVFQLWGAFDGRAYLIDQVRGKWKAPQLKLQAEEFIAKHHNPASPYAWQRVRHVKVEDKSSGTGLIQEIENSSPVPVLPIARATDKLTRAMDGQPSIEVGRVHLPRGESFLPAFEEEFDRFSSDMSHAHDDQVDPALDAIRDICGNRAAIAGIL